MRQACDLASGGLSGPKRLNQPSLFLGLWGLVQDVGTCVHKGNLALCLLSLIHTFPSLFTGHRKRFGRWICSLYENFSHKFPRKSVKLVTYLLRACDVPGTLLVPETGVTSLMGEVSMLFKKCEGAHSFLVLLLVPKIWTRIAFSSKQGPVWKLPET